jgi:hypothetical protein
VLLVVGEIDIMDAYILVNTEVQIFLNDTKCGGAAFIKLWMTMSSGTDWSPAVTVHY